MAQGPTRVVLMTTATMINLGTMTTKPLVGNHVQWKLAKVCVHYHVYIAYCYTASLINSM